METDKTFYVQPPVTKDAESWEQWLKAESKAEAQAKRKATREMVAGDLPDLFSDSVMRKVGGVWRQCTSVGMTGDGTDCSYDVATPATQEVDIEVARRIIRARGTSHQRNGAEKRKARKERRMMKRNGLL